MGVSIEVVSHHKREHSEDARLFDTGLIVTLDLASTTIELVGRFTLRDRH